MDWIDRLVINNKWVIEPIEEGTETSGEPEEVFKHGDWVDLGYIKPTKKMSWEDFLDELWWDSSTILKRAFEKLKEKLRARGFEVVESREPLFYFEGENPRLWYRVFKQGMAVAVCDLVVDIHPCLLYTSDAADE